MNVVAATQLQLGTVRAAALLTVRSLAALCEPRPWPRRPVQLAAYGRSQLLDLVSRVMSGDRGASSEAEYAACLTWLLDRSTTRHDNRNRLASLLWCVATLSACDDAEAKAMRQLAYDYLTEVWGVFDTPTSIVDRTRLAWDTVDRASRESLR